MIRVVALSHTQMTRERFCTNVAGRDTNGKVAQVRLRVKPNEALEYSLFGAQAQAFRNQLRPGSVLDIRRFLKNKSPRVTHPEDIIIKPEEVTLVQGLHWSQKVLEYAQEIAFDHVHDLFPCMHEGNGKLYRPDHVTNPRSVGYIRAQSVEYYNDGYNSKLRGRITDAAGCEFTAPVVGVDLLSFHPPVQESLVRLSLAGGFPHPSWAGTTHPERCFLMLSHVIPQ